jgi:hypothetical protein
LPSFKAFVRIACQKPVRAIRWLSPAQSGFEARVQVVVTCSKRVCNPRPGGCHLLKAGL